MKSETDNEQVLGNGKKTPSNMCQSQDCSQASALKLKYITTAMSHKVETRDLARGPGNSGLLLHTQTTGESFFILPSLHFL